MVRLDMLAMVCAQMASVLCWTWPSPRLERLDTLRFDQMGINAEAFGIASSSCNNFIVSGHGNRTNVGDWLRTAYHDMATYNITEGSGGLDGSIRFAAEQSRSENAGDGFRNTMVVLQISSVVGRWVTVADTIALSAVFALEQCGGPQIDFRGGRVDATTVNKPGVPEPQQPLAQHTASFARQGFSATEMIQLVACGHTIGGVQRTAFPTIVPPSNQQDDADGHVTFDSTFDYDNKIATEYVSGTTRNPLVIGANITTRSDLRIFSSDSNVTMRAFANNSTLFKNTCKTVITKMINTVPRSVTLTEVLVPLPAKPDALTAVHNADGSLTLVGRARFWDLDPNASRTVNLVWAAQGSSTKCSGCSSTLIDNDERTFAFAATKIVPFYSLPTAGVRIASSVGSSPKFWFEVTEGGKTSIFNQNGPGFQLQTQVLLSSTTCQSSDGLLFRVDIAVRKGLSPSRVFIQGEISSSKFDQNAPGGQTTTVTATFNATASAKDSTHDIYSVALDLSTTTIDIGRFLNVAATINGQDVVDPTYFGAGFGSPYYYGFLSNSVC